MIDLGMEPELQKNLDRSRPAAGRTVPRAIAAARPRYSNAGDKDR